MKPGYEPIPDTVRRLHNPALDLDREEVANEVMRLRYLLAMARGITYGDDGELQCSAKFPMIDYNRDPIEEIERKINERGMAELMEWIKANPEEAERRGFKLHAASDSKGKT